MGLGEIARYIAGEPFKPLVVVLNDGERIAVRRPLRALVTQDRLPVGVDEDEKTGLASRLRRVASSDVKVIEG